MRQVETPARPVGPAIEGRAALRPGPVTLNGRFVQIERLNAARHGPALWDSFQGLDWLWTYSSQGPFADRLSFDRWLKERAKLDDPHYYAVLDRQARTRGVVTLMEVRPAMRVIEIGHIVYGPSLQRSALATEAQYLIGRYVFDTLGYRRYEWKCDSLNAASRSAALRLGFRFEGVFRQHMIVKGRSRDTAWYSMLDGEWPQVRSAFEQWLSPENFDGEGRQRRRLADIRNGFGRAAESA